MNSDKHNGDVERLVKKLPMEDPPDTLWPRIESALREEQQSPVDEAPGLFARLADMFRVRALTLAAGVVVILIGVGMSWMLIRDYTERRDQSALAQDNEDIMLDAQSDIDQAIFYYERAIEKLTVLAERSAGELDPSFVKLQKEKITLLRASIEECKTAMNVNGSHPEVQHYLFAAYTDLQHTLQQMVSRAQ